MSSLHISNTSSALFREISGLIGFMLSEKDIQSSVLQEEYEALESYVLTVSRSPNHQHYDELRKVLFAKLREISTCTKDLNTLRKIDWSLKELALVLHLPSQESERGPPLARSELRTPSFQASNPLHLAEILASFGEFQAQSSREEMPASLHSSELDD